MSVVSRMSAARIGAIKHIGGRGLARRGLATHPGVIAAAVLERRAIIGKEALPIEVEFDKVQREINEVHLRSKKTHPARALSSCPSPHAPLDLCVQIRANHYPPELFAAAIAEDRRASGDEEDGEVRELGRAAMFRRIGDLYGLTGNFWLRASTPGD